MSCSFLVHVRSGVMRVMEVRRIALARAGLLAALLVFVTYGCGSTTPPPATPPASPTSPVSSTAAIGNTASAVETRPPGGGPGGVPAAPNLSLIQASIVSTIRDQRGTVLTVKVLSSQPQKGLADFGAKVVGKQIEVVVVDDAGGTYPAGQVIQGELSYRGDEHGGVYYLRHVVQP